MFSGWESTNRAPDIPGLWGTLGWQLAVGSRILARREGPSITFACCSSSPNWRAIRHMECIRFTCFKSHFERRPPLPLAIDTLLYSPFARFQLYGLVLILYTVGVRQQRARNQDFDPIHPPSAPTPDGRYTEHFDSSSPEQRSCTNFILMHGVPFYSREWRQTSTWSFRSRLCRRRSPIRT